MNHRWYCCVAANWSTLLLCMGVALHIDHPAAYWLATVVIGTRQHALAVLGHDGSHFHVHSRRWLNDAPTCLLALWPLGMGIHGYRKFHFAHHQAVGTEADPEITPKRRFQAKWQPEANRLRLFFTDLLGFGWREVFEIFRVAPPLRKVDVIGPVVTIGAMATAALLWDWRVAAMWVAALFTSFWAVFRQRAFTEHVGTDTTHRLGEPALWRKLLYLPANTWLHWEHHRRPAIPAWRLKKLGKLGDPTLAP